MIAFYIISIFLSLLTINEFVNKDISIPVGLFLLFMPVLNTIWVIYCIYKFVIKNKDSFIKDLKKAFDIK